MHTIHHVPHFLLTILQGYLYTSIHGDVWYLVKMTGELGLDLEH